MPDNITPFRIRALLAALETTEGTDAAPTPAANAIQLIGGEGRIETNRLEREIDYPHFTARPFVRTQKRAIITGQIEMVGSSTIGDPAPMGAILEAGGHAFTTEEEATVPVAGEYNPISTEIPSLSAYWYHGGERMRAVGARVGVETITAAVNGYWLARVTIQGSPEDVTEQAMPSPDFSAYQDPVAVATETLTVTLGDQEKVLDGISIEHNNNPSLAQVEHSEARVTRISDRATNGTLRIYRPAVSHINIRQLVEQHARVPMSVRIDGGSGKSGALSYPSVQLGDPQRVDVDGFVAWDIPWVAIAVDGNDDYIIRFD